MAGGKNHRNNYRENIIQEKIIREKRRRRNGMFMSAVSVIVCVIMVCAVCRGNLRKTENAQAAETENTAEFDKEYFSKSLLVGDSRAEALGRYSDVPEWDVCAAQDLTIENVMTADAAQDSSGQACTVMELASQKNYESIYVSFGLEELAMYNEEFISDYKDFLNSVIELQPSAHIYVMSILPVSAELSSANGMYNNPDIDKLNGLLENMCTVYDSVTYLDVAGCISEAGVLPEDAGTDGIHINKEYCQKIMQYIRENVSR